MIPTTSNVGRQPTRGLGAQRCSISWDRTGSFPQGKTGWFPLGEGVLPQGTREKSLRQHWGSPGGGHQPRENLGLEFVCRTSAGTDRSLRSHSNIPSLLRCSGENLLQHTQAINTGSEKQQNSSPQNKPQQAQGQDGAPSDTSSDRLREVRALLSAAPTPLPAASPRSARGSQPQGELSGTALQSHSEGKS